MTALLCQWSWLVLIGKMTEKLVVTNVHIKTVCWNLKEARLDRKDRQAAIQQMMAGLAQMGASIAI